MAICGTKTHLACIKKGCFIASTDHSISLALEQASARDVEKLINRDLEVSTLPSSNCGAENIDLSTQSSLTRSGDLLPLLRQNEILVDVFIGSVARSHILDG